MSLAYNPAEGRSPWTKWAGLAAVVGLPLGYSIINAKSEAGVPVAVVALGVGFVGYLMTLRSAYTNSRKRKLATHLDEREQRVMEHAYNYAFRAVAITVLLFCAYAAIASQPERAHLWFPRSPKQWTGIILPLALVLPLLPTIIAEWLDPAPSPADDDEG